MPEELRSWNITEELGMGIANPKPNVSITGHSEFLQNLYDLLCKEHPEWTGEIIGLNEEPITKIIIDSDNFETFKLEHPEIFNNQEKKLKFKYIANEKEAKNPS